MTLLEIGLFFGVSFIAASGNAVAGGGTFLTFPVFILNGFTPLQANIMSTIALWPGTVSSMLGYRTILKINKSKIKPFLATGILGGAVGALLLLSTPEITFKHMVPWLMLAATLIFTLGKRAIAVWRVWYPNRREHPLVVLFIQLVIAVYGGYFGAGIGILTLAMLQMMGLSNIHEMNALKTVLTTAVNSVTLLIFLFSKSVVWPVALVMAVGALLGGYIGARLAVKIPPEWVRIFVGMIGFAMTAYFFIHGV